jgi:hypothetical protein
MGQVLFNCQQENEVSLLHLNIRTLIGISKVGISKVLTKDMPTLNDY